jgi:glycosyltransferase involved in cell wall biosynthesis
MPCYKTRNQVLSVIEKIGQDVSRIYVVDDCCPEGTGEYVSKNCKDPRVVVLKNKKNLGVGGATMAGYRKALADRSNIVIKLDSDGQMDPSYIPAFVAPILAGRADYTKGNRFYTLEYLKNMPGMRLFGNAVLSLITKASTGYWNIMDPTNGFTAIHGKVLYLLPLDKLDKRYFFESDMLFRLNIIRAVVMDIPLISTYNNEPSSLRIQSASILFPGKHLLRFLKRIFYNYFLREFNLGTIEMLGSAILMGGGALFGAFEWYKNAQAGIETTSGTVMLAALPILLGFNLMLGAINYDINSIPRNVIHKVLKD